MPIVCEQILKPLDREAFGKLSYQAFGNVLAIREELGRFFDEKHYKRALAVRRQDVLLEEPVVVSHSTFRKTYFLDVTFDNRVLGPQPLSFVTKDTAFNLTALEDLESQHKFASHAQRLVSHTSIEALLWGNIARHQVTLRSLKAKK